MYQLEMLSAKSLMHNDKTIEIYFCRTRGIEESIYFLFRGSILSQFHLHAFSNACCNMDTSADPDITF